MEGQPVKEPVETPVEEPVKRYVLMVESFELGQASYRDCVSCSNVTQQVKIQLVEKQPVEGLV